MFTELASFHASVCSWTVFCNVYISNCMAVCNCCFDQSKKKERKSKGLNAHLGHFCRECVDFSGCSFILLTVCPHLQDRPRTPSPEEAFPVSSTKNWTTLEIRRTNWVSVSSLRRDLQDPPLKDVPIALIRTYRLRAAVFLIWI